MKNYRRNHSTYTLIDMEHEFVRLARLFFNEQRHETKTHNALELKRLLTLMIDPYRLGENTSAGNEKLNFE